MGSIMNWRKSSYSGSNSGNCAEIANQENRVLVRDTQDRTGPVLRFDPAAWQKFTDRVKRSLAQDTGGHSHMC
jgi:Domain of unknown function (DUF397)